MYKIRFDNVYSLMRLNTIVLFPPKHLIYVYSLKCLILSIWYYLTIKRNCIKGTYIKAYMLPFSCICEAIRVPLPGNCMEINKINQYRRDISYAPWARVNNSGKYEPAHTAWTLDILHFHATLEDFHIPISSAWTMRCDIIAEYRIGYPLKEILWKIIILWKSFSVEKSLFVTF